MNIFGQFLKTISLAATAIVVTSSLVMANSIKGQVLNKEGTGVSGLIVTATADVCAWHCGKMALQTTTDSSGSFSFLGVPLSIEPLLGAPKPTDYTLAVMGSRTKVAPASSLGAALTDWSDVIKVTLNVE